MTLARTYGLPATLGALQAMPVIASGNEGAAMVGAVQLIVGVAFLILVASLVGGVLVGARRAHREGESILKGTAYGVLKGILAFLVVCTIVTIAAAFAGFVWIVFSLWAAPLGTPDLVPPPRPS
ncbi:MAG: hypothetical protein ABIR98_10640 [Usitatibacter sp.]